ncbi:MAG: ABC transporter substrate-binding protein [Rhodothermales bacterium]|nr:ABC transporter substrate-binding protein [Rhodothermales bacterium]
MSLTAALVALPGAGTASAQNAEQTIRAELEKRDQRIKSELGQGEIGSAQRDTLKVLINGFIDFESMAAEALGPHWTDLTDAERTEFVDVFSEIVRHQSLGDLDVYRSSVTYDRITVDGNTAHVVSTTTYKDVPTIVEYHMTLTDDGWRARDIVLDDVSTVEGYSRSFQTFVRKKGFAALMDNLNKRLERISEA